MQWTDHAFVLSARRHGEHAALLVALSRAHGKVAGLARGGQGRAGRGALQPGNQLQITWTARLDEHLGRLTWEPLTAHGARWLDDPLRLALLGAACALVEAVLPDRAPHPALFDGLAGLLAALGQAEAATLYVHWEIALLAEVGYGLDLTRCAATGVAEDLIYVSPRSGRAVCRTAGEPLRDRLLPLPAFLAERRAGQGAEVGQALDMTGYFLRRCLQAQGGRPLPQARLRLAERLGSYTGQPLK